MKYLTKRKQLAKANQFRFKRKKNKLAIAVQVSLLSLSISTNVEAATLEVDSVTDDGNWMCVSSPGVSCLIPDAQLSFCELSDAINLIESAGLFDGSFRSGCIADGTFGIDDRIIFNDTLTNATIILNEKLNITKDLIIDATSIGNLNIDANQQSGLLDIEDSTVTLNNLTLTGSRQNGAINSEGSTLTINNVVLTGNTANLGAGMDARGSTVIINDSDINNNTASGGAGLFSSNSTITINNSSLTENSSVTSSGFGGAIRVADGNLTIDQSSINNNIANDGGAIATEDSFVSISNSNIIGNSVNRTGGAIIIGNSNNIFLDSSFSINSTTIANNSAVQSGGALTTANNFASNISIESSTLSNNISERGGAIHLRNSLLAIQNTTLSGNETTSTDGGAINFASGTITLSNTTITNNSAVGRGGGIFISNTGATPPSFYNTIIANNTTTTNNANDCEVLSLSSVIVADDSNIIQNDACGTNARNVDPLLGPLADNGGATLTHALKPNSPARNTGDLATCETEDQRGQVRDGGDGACDVGAIEFNPDDDFGEVKTDFYVVPLPTGKTVVIPL